MSYTCALCDREGEWPELALSNCSLGHQEATRATGWGTARCGLCGVFLGSYQAAHDHLLEKHDQDSWNKWLVLLSLKT